MKQLCNPFESNAGEPIETKALSLSQGKLIPLYDIGAAAGNSYGMEMENIKSAAMIEIGGF